MRHVINHQVVLSQAPEGPLATWLDKFADAASRQGYTRSSICRRIRLAAGFSRWLGQEGIDLSCINSQHPAQYLRYRMDLLQAGVDRAVIALWLGHIIGRDHADLSQGDASNERTCTRQDNAANRQARQLPAR